MDNILVVGGAGYVGCHMVAVLGEAGYKPVTLDNLYSGYRDAVIAGEFIQGDLNDRELLNQVLDAHDFAGVMHFAAHIEVGESVRDPAKYYRNNVANTQNLLDAMVRYGVNAFIFSSTAAIFGEPQYIPIDEQHPKAPVNPYGRSKWMVEQLLEDYDHAYGLKSCALRYFNAAGADPRGRLGERHQPESHLIPLVLQAASGRRESITLYGNDYDTTDGTCIRDYIHVSDLCDAHLLALEQLTQGGESNRYNLGNGQGYSVQEVIDAAAKVTGREIPVVRGERRPGDPATLVADSARARSKLGWSPRFADLDTIIAHAWAWEQKTSQ
ncbi:MAG TPA: UDP-glucose 4-epimerase GalE [Gammaproteobacteria bacterium]|nr:UDP-glucose 4-epimerase GalE [Gammaproteobacteria bacterium]